VTPIDSVKSLPPYDKEKYKEMILDAAETVLGFFGLESYYQKMNITLTNKGVNGFPPNEEFGGSIDGF
jgi:hypothetical protein